jgi:hypothetical protein
MNVSQSRKFTLNVSSNAVAKTRNRYDEIDMIG